MLYRCCRHRSSDHARSTRIFSSLAHTFGRGPRIRRPRAVPLFLAWIIFSRNPPTAGRGPVLDAPPLHRPRFRPITRPLHPTHALVVVTYPSPIYAETIWFLSCSTIIKRLLGCALYFTILVHVATRFGKGFQWFTVVSAMGCYLFLFASGGSFRSASSIGLGIISYEAALASASVACAPERTGVGVCMWRPDF